MLSVVGALLLLLPIVPFVRLFALPAFRRRLNLFSRMRYRLIVVVVLYGLAVIVVAVAQPRWLPWLLLSALLVSGYVFGWRSRSHYGQTRRLPPGALSIAPVTPWRDPGFHRRRTRQLGPIYKVSHFVHPMVCINRIDLARSFLRDHERSTCTPPMPFNQNIPQGFMRYLPSSTYSDFRSGFGCALAARPTLNATTTTTRRHVDQCLVKLADCHHPINPVIPLYAVSRAVMLQMIAGVSMDDARFRRADALLTQLDYRVANHLSRQQCDDRLDELTALLLARPPDRDCCLETLHRDDRLQRSIDRQDPCFSRNLVYLISTGSIDVADLLVWIWYELARHPEQLDVVAADRSDWSTPPEADLLSMPSLSPAKCIVLETLRLHQSEYLMRQTIEPIEFEGYRIPRRWLVRMGIAEAHRDSDHFDEPDSFCPQRFGDVTGYRGKFAPFGLMSKACIGSQLTVCVAKTFVEALAAAPRWTSVADGQVELGAFHWRPSSRWRLQTAR